MLTEAADVRPGLFPPRNPRETFFRGGSDNATASPMTLLSSLLGENEPYTKCKPLSSFLDGGALESPMFSPVGGDPILFNEPDNKTGFSERQTCSNHNEKSTGSESDREYDKHEHRHARASARYKAMMPSRLPIPSTTTYLTIPPGLSPTALLDSPVLFNPRLADPSPTTGSFSASSILTDKGPPVGAGSTKQEETDGFIFKPHPFPAMSDLIVSGVGCYGAPALKQADVQVQSPLASGLSSDVTMPMFESRSELALGNTQEASESSTPLAKPFGNTPVSQIPDVAHALPCFSGRTSGDGYNWKKYGQKQLKGTEYPRSYYKCTHPNCHVKKQVECSHEGEITEIMYKGEHNHPKPHGGRRGARNRAHTWDRSERGTSLSAHESAPEVSTANGKVDSDTFSADVTTSSLVLSHNALCVTPEQSFGSPSDAEDEEGEASKAEDGGEDEQESKRRRIENVRDTLPSAPIRTIREPRVVVQTTSEIDILDDGYRWRKYGQKIVKGNLFPRSYYKCTNVGCIVRKHVERSSTDPKSVITAYEGKHNHNVPVARGSARELSGAPGPPPLSTYAGGVMSFAGPSMSFNTQELGSIVENRSSVRNKFSVDMASTCFRDFDRNGGGLVPSLLSVTRAMGPITGEMRPLVAGEVGGQGLGLTLLQPIYPPSSSSSFTTGGHWSRP